MRKKYDFDISNVWTCQEKFAYDYSSSIIIFKLLNFERIQQLLRTNIQEKIPFPTLCQFNLLLFFYVTHTWWLTWHFFPFSLGANTERCHKDGSGSWRNRLVMVTSYHSVIKSKLNQSNINGWFTYPILPKNPKHWRSPI